MSLGLFIVTRGAYWQKHGGWLVKYRCKLEQAHNEEPFNNAFDLNRNVMKIITSLARPGDAPINGRSTTIRPSLFTLCVPPSISRLDLPRSSSLSLFLSLSLIFRVIGRFLWPARGQTTNLSEVAVQNGHASGRPNALFEGQTWKMKRSSVVADATPATERPPRPRFRPYCRLPPRSTPSSLYPLLATCLLLTDRGEKIMNRSSSSSSFFEIQSQLQQSCSCKMEVPFLRLFFLLNRLFFFIGYSEIIVVNIVYFVLYCSFELEWIDVSQWLRDKTWLVPSKGAFFILTCWKKESWSASRIRISSSSETSKLCFTHTFVTHVSNDVAHVIRLVPSKFFDVKSFPDYDR